MVRGNIFNYLLCLINEIFTNKMPSLIDNILTVCTDLKTNKDVYTKGLDFGLMIFDM
jgi:hypothetical protein